MAKMCEDFNLHPKKMEYFYEFLVHYLNYISDKPEVTVIRFPQSLGSMFCRSKVLRAASEDWRGKETPMAKKFFNIYEKRLETLENAFEDPNLTHYTKTATINSHFLSLGMTKEEMELAQNEDFEKNNRVD